MKYFIMTWLMLMSLIQAYACDICGCPAGSSSLGILPRINGHFIGIRAYTRHFVSTHPPSILSPEEKQAYNRYTTTELWGRWQLMRRMQIFAFVPYQQYNQHEDGIKLKNTGIGDASFLVNGIFINTGDSACGIWRHFLMGGAGLKLPTGRLPGDENPNMQTGTGSTDILANLSYTVRRGASGLQTECNYRYNTENRYHYRFGQRFSAGAKLFRLIDRLHADWLPYAGFLYESSNQDVRDHIYVKYTGGNIGLANVGTEYYAGRINAGIAAQLPLVQQLGDGMIKAGQRFSAHVLLNF